MTLNRYEYKNHQVQKLYSNIKINEEIQTIQKDNTPLTFSIAAVIVHKGRPRIGHYIIYIKTEKQRWVCINDDKTSYVSHEEVFF